MRRLCVFAGATLVAAYQRSEVIEVSVREPF
jgi:hypothetical protein